MQLSHTLGTLASKRSLTMFENILAKYPDDELFAYIVKENPRSLTLDYWHNHFEMRFLKRCIRKEYRVFDFGCGSGCMDVLLHSEGYDIFGYDESKALIEVSRSHGSGVVFYDTFPKYEQYHRVWMCHVIEHIPTNAFEGVFRQFHVDTPILISTPLGKSYDDGSGHHINHWFSKEELERTLSSHVYIDWTAEFPEDSVIRAQVWPRS